MTKREIVGILMEHNTGQGTQKPAGRNVLAVIDQYASCLMSYLEAVENLERNGSIVAHPRTGTPIENPYLKVRSLAMSDMRKCTPPKGVEALWRIITSVEPREGQ